MTTGRASDYPLAVEAVDGYVGTFRLGLGIEARNYPSRLRTGQAMGLQGPDGKTRGRPARVPVAGP